MDSLGMTEILPELLKILTLLPINNILPAVYWLTIDKGINSLSRVKRSQPVISTPRSDNLVN